MTGSKNVTAAGDDEPLVRRLYEIFIRNHGAFKAFIRRLKYRDGGLERTTEVLHEGLLRSLDAIGRRLANQEPLEFSDGALHRYLEQAMRSALSDLRRRLRSATPAGDGGDVPAPEEDPMADEDLAQAIFALDETEREVINLKHFANLSFEDVAKCMGRSKGRVRLTYERALGKLRRRLGIVGPNEGEAK